jgi:hypothetical protein
VPTTSAETEPPPATFLTSDPVPLDGTTIVLGLADEERLAVTWRPETGVQIDHRERLEVRGQLLAHDLPESSSPTRFRVRPP